MTVIKEDDDEFDWSATSEPAQQVKPAVIKQPLAHATTMASKSAPIKPATVLKQSTMTAVSQIKTSNRRISNIDRLKMELAVRQATMNPGKKAARRKDDSSDDNESSDDDSDTD